MKLLHSLAFVAALTKASLLLVNASPLIGPLAGLAPSSPTSTAFPSPDIDPFYRAPASIAHYSPGQVVRTRLTNSTFSKDHLSHSYQVMVRSASTQMLPIGAVATILVPKNVSSKAAPKILSYQYFEDSVSQSCSPSWNYVDTPKPMNTTGGKSANSEAPWYVNWALERGYYVVIPDHEGPNSAFMAGHQGGKIVLDSIRALINHESLPKRKSQIAMFGYSGGAHATAWATIMHESWAPELNIIGAVHGGTPIDPENLLNHLNAGPFSGWAGAGIVGLMHAYPELDHWVHQHLVPGKGGAELLEKAAAPGICIGEFFLDFMFVDYDAKVDMPNPIKQPIPQKVVRRESLLKSKGE